jgi:hypothetical protein
MDAFFGFPSTEILAVLNIIVAGVFYCVDRTSLSTQTSFVLFANMLVGVCYCFVLFFWFAGVDTGDITVLSVEDCSWDMVEALYFSSNLMAMSHIVSQAYRLRRLELNITTAVITAEELDVLVLTKTSFIGALKDALPCKVYKTFQRDGSVFLCKVIWKFGLLSVILHTIGLIFLRVKGG